jgi:hypothetical protein
MLTVQRDKPCRRCGSREFYTQSNRCATCARAYAARWDAAHQEAALARRRRYLARLRAERRAREGLDPQAHSRFETALAEWKAAWDREPTLRADELDRFWADLDSTYRTLWEAAFDATQGLRGAERAAALAVYEERISSA